MEFLFKEWQETWIPELKEREIEIELPTKIRKIIAITGVRRSGKTYTMFQLIKNLEEKNPRENIFYLNFEDERLEKTKEALTKIMPTLIKMYGDQNKKYFLFLDEIQVMPSWSQWLRRIFDKYRNVNFFVTGSSSKLSSKEIPTELRGRALNYEIFPLSFREFLSFKEIKPSKHFEYSEVETSLIQRMLEEYLKFGGFPEVVLEESKAIKKKLVQDYFSSIVNRDIVERHKVKKIDSLKNFLRLLLNSTYLTYNKATDILKSQGMKIGKETVIKYSAYAQESYFVYFVPIFSRKVKDVLRYPKKVYFADNSFLTNLSLKFSEDFGRLMENLTAIELLRRNQEIFYYKSNDKEVDFVVKNGLRVKQLIQVCYDIRDYDVKQRELNAVIRASKELRCNKLIIITWNYEASEEFKRKKVKFIPLWKWLLG